MKRYDIGILTFWNVPNYGTYAQAYALQKVLQSLNKTKEVKQIAHLDKHHYNFYYNIKQYYRENKIWKKAFWKSFLMKETKTEQKEKNFLNAYDEIPHTDEISMENYSDFTFDRIFIGSDIVWDFSLEPFNCDRMLFGENLNGRVNSYAASFGTVKNGDKLPDYVIENIKKMQYISVRDDNSARIVETITGTKPDIVLDPVWLWDFNGDCNIELPREENYILVYGQNFTEEFLMNLQKYAKRAGLSIIALDCNNDRYNWCERLVKQEELSPLQWIGYFLKASAVATSTFHGLTFGLLFNKKIAFCKTDFIMDKVDVFLMELGLYDLFQVQSDVKEMLDYDWNYKKINEIIEVKRRKSTNFLEKACGI
ncbi:MAG: polysaccharide pyruvyl transferase family protein [Dorea sp.]|jgi:hypothetical protein|nr:polysaccharide pyruvyl transferase family protein [Dorea sp.]